MSRHSEGLEEAVLKVASGGAQRNPRWGGGEYVGLEEVAMPAAGLRPERVRRDESRLYVADFLCGRGDSVQTVRLTPPYGGACLAVCFWLRRRCLCGAPPRTVGGKKAALLRWLLLRLRASSTLSAPLFFNMENRIFSTACTVARKYTKIRNA